MNISEVSKEIYETNMKNGFWKEGRNIGDPDRNFAEACMLLVTEVSEAVEADRKGHRADLVSFESEQEPNEFYTAQEAKNDYKQHYEDYVKDSIEAELAGTFIRLADIAYGFGIDLEKFVRLELDYNKLRQPKHGKKY